MEQITKQQIPLPISIIVSKNNGVPMIELRKTITDVELIKLIVSSAYHEKALIIVPTFANKIRSLSSLIDKGFVYVEDDKYYFNF